MVFIWPDLKHTCSLECEPQFSPQSLCLIFPILPVPHSPSPEGCLLVRVLSESRKLSHWRSESTESTCVTINRVCITSGEQHQSHREWLHRDQKPVRSPACLRPEGARNKNGVELGSPGCREESQKVWHRGLQPLPEPWSARSGRMTGRGQGTRHPTILTLMTSDASRSRGKEAVQAFHRYIPGAQRKGKRDQKRCSREAGQGEIRLYTPSMHPVFRQVQKPTFPVPHSIAWPCVQAHRWDFLIGRHWELHIQYASCLVTCLMRWHRTKTQTWDPSYKRVFKRIPTYPKHALFIQKEKQG